MVPDKIAHYEIISQIAAGGMATIFKARDPAKNGRLVAIKVMATGLTQQPEYVARFRQEMELITSLEGPSIVPVYDYGEDHGRLYIVMRYLPDGSLKDRLDSGPLPPNEVSGYLNDLAQALDAVHQKKVIHRDIKPANILLHNGVAHLSDFGIAKLADETVTETNVGTYPYMAPEQWQNKPITAQTDIYQLGIMLFELLTGKRPFIAQNNTLEAYLNLHLHTRLPDLHTIHPGLPRDLNKVLQKAAAKEPAARYQTVGELAAAFATALVQPRPIPRRNLVAGAASFLVFIALTAAWWQWSPNQDGQTSPTPSSTTEGAPAIVQEQNPEPNTTVSPTSTPTADSPTTAPAVVPGTASATAIQQPTVTQTATATPTASATPSPTVDPRTPPASPSAGTVWTRPQDGMNMVYVPGGRVTLGSTEAEIDAALAMCETARGIGGCNRAQFSVEGPPQAVNLDSFWLDQTEVSQSQYAQCVRAGSCRPHQGGGEESSINNPAFASYPVTHVTWSNARDYCAWAGGELPTAAQWEYAARGSERRIFPWGNRFVAENANFCDANCQYGWREAGYDDGHASLAPVDSYLNGASWAGALNLAGNVWEWTDSAGSSDSVMQLRGGSWSANHWLLRAAAQDAAPLSTANANIGFRCLLPAPP